MNKYLSIYNKEISPEIMDFQIHVRKETGGNDRAVVDSTKLSQTIHKGLDMAGKQEAESMLKQLYLSVKNLDTNMPGEASELAIMVKGYTLKHIETFAKIKKIPLE